MKSILMDENDNQANWLELLRTEVWKEVYIPKNLRKKYKISFNAKTNTITLKKKKNVSN